eukprot:XP_001695592.1 predicted protein [Chlamydomonas reinhardtii]
MPQHTALVSKPAEDPGSGLAAAGDCSAGPLRLIPDLASACHGATPAVVAGAADSDAGVSGGAAAKLPPLDAMLSNAHFTSLAAALQQLAEAHTQAQQAARQQGSGGGMSPPQAQRPRAAGGSPMDVSPAAAMSPAPVPTDAEVQAHSHVLGLLPPPAPLRLGSAAVHLPRPWQGGLVLHVLSQALWEREHQAMAPAVLQPLSQPTAGPAGTTAAAGGMPALPPLPLGFMGNLYFHALHHMQQQQQQQGPGMPGAGGSAAGSGAGVGSGGPGTGAASAAGALAAPPPTSSPEAATAADKLQSSGSAVAAAAAVTDLGPAAATAAPLPGLPPVQEAPGGSVVATAVGAAASTGLQPPTEAATAPAIWRQGSAAAAAAIHGAAADVGAVPAGIKVEPTPGNVSTTAMTEAKAEAAAADAKAMACAESTCAKAARDTDNEGERRQLDVTPLQELLQRLHPNQDVADLEAATALFEMSRPCGGAAAPPAGGAAAGSHHPPPRPGGWVSSGVAGAAPVTGVGCGGAGGAGHGVGAAVGVDQSGSGDSSYANFAAGCNAAAASGKVPASGFGVAVDAHPQQHLQPPRRVSDHRRTAAEQRRRGLAEAHLPQHPHDAADSPQQHHFAAAHDQGHAATRPAPPSSHHPAPTALAGLSSLHHHQGQGQGHHAAALTGGAAQERPPFRYIVRIGNKWRAQVGHTEDGVQRKYYSNYVDDPWVAAKDADRILYKLRGAGAVANLPLSEVGVPDYRAQREAFLLRASAAF